MCPPTFQHFTHIPHWSRQMTNEAAHHPPDSPSGFGRVPPQPGLVEDAIIAVGDPILGYCKRRTSNIEPPFLPTLHASGPHTTLQYCDALSIASASHALYCIQAASTVPPVASPFPPLRPAFYASSRTHRELESVNERRAKAIFAETSPSADDISAK
jgi:hypothetical protein